MEKTILEVKNLTVKKGTHKILDKINFEVNQGDTIAIIGPNGAGKTTLFRAILNLIPYEGEVKWKEGIKVGYVPQKLYVDADLPLTAKEFFMMKEKHLNKIREVLKSVGIEGEDRGESAQSHILKNRLGDLSGGELQRVLIAWSLLGNPDVLLFDEPTAGVDFVGEETVYSLLERLKKEHNLSIMLISHEIDIIRGFSTKVLCLNKESICFGPPREAINQATIDQLFGEEVHLYHHHHGDEKS
jgi:zinc transport system ATP-binding protein